MTDPSKIQIEVDRDPLNCCIWLRLKLGGRVIGQTSISDLALVTADKVDLPKVFGDAIERLRGDYKARMDPESLRHAIDAMTAPYRSA